MKPFWVLFVLQEGTSKFASLDHRLNNKYLNKVTGPEMLPNVRLEGN